MLRLFSSRAVAMASFNGNPSQKRNGIMPKAAPTPAMVSTVVKQKTIRAAINRVDIFGSNAQTGSYVSFVEDALENIFFNLDQIRKARFRLR